MHFLNIVFIASIGISLAQGAVTIKANQSSASVNLNTRSTTEGTVVTDIKEFPYQASLQVAATSKHLCSASLIDDQNLLTSAYCVHESNDDQYELMKANTLQVVMGATKIGDTNIDDLITIRLKYIFIHENWNGTTREHDIAVIRIHEGIDPFTDYVKSTNFATTTPAVGAECTSTGWSHDSTSTTHADLMKVTFTKREKTECTAVTGTVGDDEFCGNSDSKCKGEMGSPVIYNYLQVGIVSSETCESDTGTMTDVAFYKDWIKTQQKRSGSISLLNNIYLISFCIYACFFTYRSL